MRKNISSIAVNRDLVPSSANCANGSVGTKSICMVFWIMRFISAGEYPSDGSCRSISLNLVNTNSAEHTCRALCQSEGICKIETTPESISATFTGRHETFQYTKVR